MTASTLLATVGTSLFQGDRSPQKRDLLARLQDLDWTERSAGAELNSLALLQSAGYVSSDCVIHYFLSDTDEGQLVGDVLLAVIGRDRVRLHRVEGLDPGKPDVFARKGLARLAVLQCKVLDGLDHNYCALDVTGGFKAQTAIAVTLGQALQLPVYYRHESFPKIIALPPLPVSLDVELWCKHAPLFFELADGQTGSLPALPVDPRLLALLEIHPCDDEFLVELNATGVIFHRSHSQRWPEHAETLLPKPALKKQTCTLADHGWPDRKRLMKTMEHLVKTVPYITRCHGVYLNPKLPRPNTFLIRGKELLGQCSDGTYTVRFRIHTTARGEGQRMACLADLLRRLELDLDGKLLW